MAGPRSEVSSRPVDVRRVTVDDDLKTAQRITDVAWLSLEDTTLIERHLPVLRTAEMYLAIDPADGGAAVGATGVFVLDLGLPGGFTTVVSGVTDTAVLPSHRRCGVMTALMDRLVSDAVSAQRCALVLYSTEATIYGRFGFVPCSRSKQVRVSVERTRLRSDIRRPSGRISVVAPDRRVEYLPEIYSRALARRPGEVNRSGEFWAAHLAGPRSEPAEDRLCVVHEGDHGAGDGYALFTVERHWDSSGPRLQVDVVEMVAVDDNAELAVWAALFDLDLVRTVTASVPSDTMLYEVLEDRAAISVTGEEDHLWVRLLDVPAALGARRYRMPGRAVLEVVDASLGQVAGVWKVEVNETGVATVTAADATEAELRLGCAELGSCWMGGGSFHRLVSLGRVEELIPGAAARADALFGWQPSAWTVHEF